MSDDKVSFNDHGEYTIGQPIRDMNVNQGAGQQRSSHSRTIAPPPEEAPARPVVKPRAQGFSMAALRNRVAQQQQNQSQPQPQDQATSQDPTPAPTASDTSVTVAAPTPISAMEPGAEHIPSAEEIINSVPTSHPETAAADSPAVSLEGPETAVSSEGSTGTPEDIIANVDEPGGHVTTTDSEPVASVNVATVSEVVVAEAVIEHDSATATEYESASEDINVPEPQPAPELDSNSGYIGESVSEPTVEITTVPTPDTPPESNRETEIVPEAQSAKNEAQPMSGLDLHTVSNGEERVAAPSESVSAPQDSLQNVLSFASVGDNSAVSGVSEPTEPSADVVVEDGEQSQVQPPPPPATSTNREKVQDEVSPEASGAPYTHFQAVSNEELCALCSINPAVMQKWISRALREWVSNPAAVFSHKEKPALRAYAMFTPDAKKPVIYISYGFEDKLTAQSYDSKRNKFADVSSKIRIEGTCAYIGTRPIANIAAATGSAVKL